MSSSSRRRSRISPDKQESAARHDEYYETQEAVEDLSDQELNKQIKFSENRLQVLMRELNKLEDQRPYGMNSTPREDEVIKEQRQVYRRYTKMLKERAKRQEIRSAGGRVSSSSVRRLRDPRTGRFVSRATFLRLRP